MTVELGPAELDRIVAGLAGRIGCDHGDGVVLVGVLRGAVLFLADLVRHLEVNPVVDFLAVSPYTPGTGRVRLLLDLTVDIAGRRVVLVEDVVDTGLTVAYLAGELRRRQPEALDVCTLVDKRARRLVPVELRYVGVTVADEFVVGYGLDHLGRDRNLPSLVTADPELLRRDPDADVAGHDGKRPGASRAPRG